MKTKIILAILCIAFIESCKKSSQTYTPSCTGAAKSWATDVKPLLSANCVSCHSSFSNYTTVSNSLSTIRSKVVDGSMPQSSSLTSTQKDIIVCWIDNGAKNN